MTDITSNALPSHDGTLSREFYIAAWRWHFYAGLYVAPFLVMLAVTGLTHRQAYKDIFAITLIKTMAVFVVIASFYLTGWV